MKSRYDLIDAFPSSYSKYELSLIAETLSGNKYNPCNILYEKIDKREHASSEDMIENLAFERPEAMQMFLDAKSHLFNSRRVDTMRLARYLERTYDFDTPKIREFDDDKRSLFLVLFHETYNPQDNSLEDSFMEARAASHRFKDRRDRMTRLDANVNLLDVVDEIPKFEDIMNGGGHAPTLTEYYLDEPRERLVIMLRQEEKRELVPRYEFRTKGEDDIPSEPEIVNFENYPVRESAIQIQNDSNGSEIQVYSAVSTWEETLMRFFTTTINQDLTDPLQKRQSVAAKEIMEEVKEHTTTEGVDPITAGAQVEDIVTNNIESAAQDVEEDDTALNEDSVESHLSNMIVTGIHVDGEETTFEIHSSNGIREMIQEYEGIASSLAEAVSDADIDDVTIYAKIPSGADEGDEFVLENGEWYMDSGGSERTMMALEAVLK